MYFIYLLFFINISYLKKLVIIFFLIPIIGILLINNSTVLENRYKSSKYFNLMKIFNHDEKNNLIEIIKKDTHLSHYYISLKILKENFIFGKGFKTYRIESYNKKYFDDNFNFTVRLWFYSPSSITF